MTDETVLVGKTTTNRSRRAYHTDPECNRLPTYYREWDRDEAEHWGFTECAYCADAVERRPDGGDKSIYEAALKAGKSGGDEIDV